MKDHWQAFWDTHANRVGRDEPLRQVLRVEDRQPVSEASFLAVAERIKTLLALAPDHALLDLCCGNGLLTALLESSVDRVVAVDFCAPLLDDVPSRTSGRTTTILADARTWSPPAASFDRVLMAAALQHFTLAETVSLFRRMVALLRPGGVLLVTDIPDTARLWTFHDTAEREAAHFAQVARGAPILGTWFDRTWLEKLGRHVGFDEVAALAQPSSHPYARYRFDLRCRR